MSDTNDKGFTVRDKRFSASEDSDKQHSEDNIESQKKQEQADQATEASESSRQASKEPPPLPEINFSTFIISLSSSAMFHFGEIPDPATNKKQRNLPLAKQTIDILGIIQEKTRGNLTEEENKLLDNLLYDLRMRYVEENKKEKS